jgi:hypothetical protein
VYKLKIFSLNFYPKVKHRIRKISEKSDKHVSHRPPVFFLTGKINPGWVRVGVAALGGGRGLVAALAS